MIYLIPNLTGKRPKTYPRGRVCTSCTARLSIYNPRPRCAQCAPLVRLRATDSEQQDALEQLAALMAEEF